MNRDKWENPEMPLSHLGLKLAEETGEVVSEILDASEANWADEDRLKRMRKEAGHVRFIAAEIQKRADDLLWEMSHSDEGKKS